MCHIRTGCRSNFTRGLQCGDPCFKFSHGFQDQLVLSIKIYVTILFGIALNLLMNLRINDILTVSNIPIHEHCMCLYLQTFFDRFHLCLQFLAYRFYAYFIRFLTWLVSSNTTDILGGIILCYELLPCSITKCLVSSSALPIRCQQYAFVTTKNAFRHYEPLVKNHLYIYIYIY